MVLSKLNFKYNTKKSIILILIQYKTEDQRWVPNIKLQTEKFTMLWKDGSMQQTWKQLISPTNGCCRLERLNPNELITKDCIYHLKNRITDKIQSRERKWRKKTKWEISLFMKAKVLVAQLYPTLCNPMDCSPLGSSAHGILQARIMEWVAITFSRESSQPRDSALPADSLSSEPQGKPICT